MKTKITIEEFKKRYDEACTKVLINPIKDLNDEQVKSEAKFALSLSGMLLFAQLRKELFGEEK